MANYNYTSSQGQPYPQYKPCGNDMQYSSDLYGTQMYQPQQTAVQSASMGPDQTMAQTAAGQTMGQTAGQTTGQTAGQAMGQTTGPAAGPGVMSIQPSVTGFAPGTSQTAVSDLAAITPLTQPMPLTVESLQYYNGFLRTQIGRKVTVDFLIGTNTLTDRTGTLLAVGANYIVLNEIETDDILVCDFYSIKFVRVYL